MGRKKAFIAIIAFIILVLLPIVTIGDLLGVTLYLPYRTLAPLLATEKEWTYWIVFWGLVVTVAASMTFVYYRLREDKTEAFAIFAAFFFFIFAGGEDLLFYAIHEEPLPPELPWLDFGPQSIFDRIVGNAHVTHDGLIASVIFWYAVGFVFIYWLYKQKG